MRKRAKSHLAENRKSQPVGTEERKAHDEPQRLIQELQIHQIELEIQNEELKRTRHEAETERERYADLYDFAPVGYFTLDSGGIIRQANLAGAGLLGVERSRLMNVRFGRFLSEADRPIFNAFLGKVFANRIKDACDVSLNKEGSQRSYIHIEANVTEDGRECRIAVLDITERRKAEEELQKAELHYRLLHETILQGVVYQDAEGKIISMNEAAVRILGRNQEEYLGHTSESMEHPSLRADGSLLPGCDHPSMVALRTGKELRDVVMGVYNPREKDYRWITVRAMPLFRPGEDKPHQVYIIFDDITERKQIEKTLQDSEIRYRRLFEEAHDGILIINAETGQIVDVNPFLMDMLGYSHEEFVGKKLWEIGAFKDIEESKIAFTELQNKQYIRYENLPVETKDGRLISVEFVSNVYLVDHSKVIQCNIRDITERKRIEDAQLFLIKRSSTPSGEDFFISLARYLGETLGMDYVCIDRLLNDNLSAQTVAIYFDGKYEDNVAYTLKDTPCGDVVGKAICCFPKDVSKLFPNDAVLQEMNAESYMGVTLWSFQGQPIGLIAVIGRKPLVNPKLAESILHLVAIRAAGELERRDAEEELKRRADQLEEANKELESFSYSVSHDLRSPLRAIDGYSRMILKKQGDQFDEDTRSKFNVIRESTRMMGQLIEDLLAFSRLGKASVVH